MGIRDYGALDSYLAGMVMHSKLSDKVKSFSIFGFNADVDTVSTEDVWETGGRYDYLTVDSVLSIVSTDAADTAAGAGLESAAITGLDINYNPISEIITLNGVTPVLTNNKFYRVNSMTGLRSDPADVNIKASGDITASVSTNTQSTIFTGNITARQTMFAVRAGYTGYIKQAWLSGDSNQNFIMRFAVRASDGVFISGNDFEMAGNNFASLNFNPGLGNIKEKSDIKLEAQAKTQNSEVRVNYTLILIRDDYLKSLADSI